MKGTAMHQPTEYVEPDPSLSSDASNSTYEKSEDGVGTVEIKGKPTESSDTSTSSTSTDESTTTRKRSSS